MFKWLPNCCSNFQLYYTLVLSHRLHFIRQNPPVFPKRWVCDSLGIGVRCTCVMTHFGWICAAAAKESCRDEISRGPFLHMDLQVDIYYHYILIWLMICMFQLHTWNWYHVQILFADSPGTMGLPLGFLASPNNLRWEPAGWAWMQVPQMDGIYKCIHTLVRKHRKLKIT